MSTVSTMDVETVELSAEDTDLLCDAMLSYHTFSAWYYGSSREDTDLLLWNLLENPTSGLGRSVGFIDTCRSLKQKYDCDERVLVTSLVMSYAVDARR